MRMSNELEQIMKRRLEKSSQNSDDASNTNNVAFMSPSSSRTTILKKKKAFASSSGTNGNSTSTSTSFNPSENKDRNDDETVTTIATNTSSLNDLNRLNQYDNNSQEQKGDNNVDENVDEDANVGDDAFIKKDVITDNSTASEAMTHNQLQGQARLTSVVRYLEKSCPWTASITPMEMLQWLKSELDEIENELKLLNAWKESCEKKEVNMDDSLEKEVEERRISEYNCLIKSLTSEMGDILFDTMMLEMIIRREYNLKENVSYQTASEKVERRTPYMKEWGDGQTVARTSEDADRIWQEVKKAEKKSAEKSLESSIRAYLEKELGMNNSDSSVSHSATNTKSQNIEEDDESGLHEVKNNVEIQNGKLNTYPSGEVVDLFVPDHGSESNQGTEDALKLMVQTKEIESKTTQVSANDFSSIDNEQENLSSSPANSNPSRIQNYYRQTVGIHAAVGFAAGSLMMALVQKCRR